MALGLAPALFVSGAIGAFVTPFGLPTQARIALGTAAEARDPDAVERSAEMPTAA